MAEEWVLHAGPRVLDHWPAAAPLLALASSSVAAPSIFQHGEGTPAISDLEHPVAAYLNGLASSSRRPLSALEWIARRSTQVYTAETTCSRSAACSRRTTSPLPPTACSALRGVLRECWQGQLMTTEEHQAAISVPAVCGKSERRGRDLSAADLRSLFDA